MDIEIKKTCPLGHTCRKTVGDHIEECMWNIKLVGENPQSGESIDEYGCAIAWQPVLAIEGNKETRGVAVSLQSFRNETVARQDAALEVIDAKAISN